MSLEISYGTVVEKYHIYNPPAVKYAIVRHHPRSGALNFYPDTVPVQNIAAGTGKGDPIRVESNWWHYMEKINSTKGYQYNRSIGSMWVNGGYDIDTPYSTALAESIHCGGNFVSYDMETGTHIRLVSYDFRMDTNLLDFTYDNWFYKPYLFWKACAINAEGIIRNVGAALDVYFPLISERELWMAKQDVELFPDGPDYRLYGTDVYNRNSPLLVNGEFYGGFHLDTRGVIAPA